MSLVAPSHVDIWHALHSPWTPTEEWPLMARPPPLLVPDSRSERAAAAALSFFAWSPFFFAFLPPASGSASST